MCQALTPGHDAVPVGMANMSVQKVSPSFSLKSTWNSSLQEIVVLRA